MAQTTPLTLFKWGYEGWGNATDLLVRTTNAIEHDRDHAPPFFVDIRFHRSVRAKGFRDRAFEELLGAENHRWMKSLGNAAVGDERARGEIKIYKPEAAEELLDLAIEAANENRRVIFFCNCPSPLNAKDRHRAEVAQLLLHAARKRKRDITIEEWPGGMPAADDVHQVTVDPSELRKSRKGALYVQLTDAQASTHLAGLPWGGFVELVANGEKQIVSAGPLGYRAGRWRLRLFLVPQGEEDTPDDLLPDALGSREELQIDPLHS